MAAPQLFLQGLSVAQVGLALYGAYHSYLAITLLQEYESATKKAAEWSNEAQRQLDQTRSTQGAGALAILASVIGAGVLAVSPQWLPYWARFGLSPALLLATVGARYHIKQFWGPQGGTRVPLPKMGDFNRAQRATKAVMDVLALLEYSWVATTFGRGMIGR